MDVKLTTPISSKKEISYEEAATIGVGTEVSYDTHTHLSPHQTKKKKNKLIITCDGVKKKKIDSVSGTLQWASNPTSRSESIARSQG